MADRARPFTLASAEICRHERRAPVPADGRRLRRAAGRGARATPSSSTIARSCAALPAWREAWSTDSAWHPGDRVALVMRNEPAYLETMLGGVVGRPCRGAGQCQAAPRRDRLDRRARRSLSLRCERRAGRRASRGTAAACNHRRRRRLPPAPADADPLRSTRLPARTWPGCSTPAAPRAGQKGR